jgi:hypothetical protein
MTDSVLASWNDGAVKTQRPGTEARVYAHRNPFTGYCTSSSCPSSSV